MVTNTDMTDPRAHNFIWTITSIKVAGVGVILVGSFISCCSPLCCTVSSQIILTLTFAVSFVSCKVFSCDDFWHISTTFWVRNGLNTWQILPHQLGPSHFIRIWFPTLYPFHFFFCSASLPLNNPNFYPPLRPSEKPRELNGCYAETNIIEAGFFWTGSCQRMRIYSLS